MVFDLRRTGAGLRRRSRGRRRGPGSEPGDAPALDGGPPGVALCVIVAGTPDGAGSLISQAVADAITMTKAAARARRMASGAYRRRGASADATWPEPAATPVLPPGQQCCGCSKSPHAPELRRTEWKTPRTPSAAPTTGPRVSPWRGTFASWSRRISPRSGRAAGSSQGGQQHVHQVPVDPGYRRDRSAWRPRPSARERGCRADITRRASCQQGIQRGGEGEDVAGFCRAAASETPPAARRPDVTPQRLSCVCLSSSDGGQPEVGQSRIAVAVDQDVGWFDVAVQHAARVGGGQRIGDLDANLADPLFAGPVLGLEPLGQGPARAQFHHRGRAGRPAVCRRRGR